ncbi:type I methionyl aminopeptidase [Frankia sp. CNm7]|uniref:Methionine aminopeptidase n=1 Tax=Frankia nepalensis TaxID=1836974 RepID=A0A937RA77_9ACTN|nr:type I methionyl aminopeptidase [Frankia nepalensis]MBL7501575.1 type I methionyl aminopeptidase [Frankia nepalensis]MBL7512872.1 type I methionyl aminopeptidase [Frankia nepalensis]MBL7521117.1 type I methionyl aminopeptidase [Frankia nepalensis]MBL7626735.1 type I methionyl aminopeptidase [Frankia nepalensis]
MARREHVQIKTAAEIAKMRVAGLLVAQTLDKLREAAVPGVTTADLDALAERTIRAGGGIPSFKGYAHPPYPASICSSVNDEVVHAIPSRKRVLRSGDIISIDCGAIVDGWHGDAAITVPVGNVAPEVLDMIRVCEESLWRGLAAAQLGGKLTDISHAVEQHIRPFGYGIVDNYGGHGIGTEMHQPPHILNHGRPGRGIKLTAGLALAIEPMITMGSPDTKVLEDDWTVSTMDGSLAAHTEHTVAITPRGPWVLTAHDGGAAKLAALGVACGQPAQATT